MMINVPIIVCYFFKLLTLSLFIMMINIPIIVCYLFKLFSFKLIYYDD